MTMKKKAKIVLLYALMPFAWVIDNAVKAFSFMASRRKAVLSCMLTAAMLLTMLPAFTVPASATTTYTSTYTGSQGNVTLSSGSYLLNGATFTGATGQNGIAVAAGAKVTLYISGTVTVKAGGAAANGNGGKAGIYVPSGAMLTVLKADGAASATLNVTGGSGGNAYVCGGGGGGAAIGTNGGNGGAQGSGYGANGGNGQNGAAIGIVVLHDSVTLSLTGGSAGKEHNGFDGSKGFVGEENGEDNIRGGNGGNGGGGSGWAGSQLGTGGGGGGAGGNGGRGGYQNGYNNWSECGGGGGGGGGGSGLRNGSDASGYPGGGGGAAVVVAGGDKSNLGTAGAGGTWSSDVQSGGTAEANGTLRNVLARGGISGKFAYQRTGGSGGSGGGTKNDDHPGSSGGNGGNAGNVEGVYTCLAVDNGMTPITYTMIQNNAYTELGALPATPEHPSCYSLIGWYSNGKQVDESMEIDGILITITAKWSESHTSGEYSTEWASDYSTCTQKTVCAVCGKTFTEAVKTTSTVKQPLTCLQDGINEYSAVFTNPVFDASHKSATKSITTPKGGHSFTEYGVCTVCGYVDPNVFKPNSNGVYELKNANDMLAFAALCKVSINPVNAILTADIDMSGVEWTPIGKLGNRYNGNFNGNFHTISGLNGMLFGIISGAKIEKVILKGGTFHSDSSITDYTGSIVGYSNVSNSEILYCSSDSVLTGTPVGDCGGIVGKAEGTVYYCAFTGKIDAGDKIAGGIVGSSGGAGKLKIRYCYMSGTINSTSEYIADIVGYLHTSNTVTYCYYNSSLSSEGCVCGESGSTLSNNGGKNANAFSSGEVCYLLNKKKTDGSQIWRQTCGEGLPAFSGSTVYYGYENCTDTAAKYANVPLSATAIAHSYNDFGVCTSCGDVNPTFLKANASGYYELDSVNDLKWFAAYVNGGKTGANAMLLSDIEYMDNNSGNNEGYAPIISSYAGTFDGNGFTISKTDSIFMAALLDGGEIKNLTISDEKIWPGGACGGIVGTNSGIIENCTVHNPYMQNSSRAGFGGIAGTNTGTIRNCAVIGGTMMLRYGASNNPGGYSMGGISGVNSGKIENCYLYNTALRNGVTHSAIVFDEKEDGTISNCYYYSNSSYKVDDTTAGGTALTAAQFASGEAAYLLNSGKTDGTQAWYQTCGTGLPAFSGATVYRGYVNCGATKMTYSNTALSETIPEHTYGEWMDNSDGTHSHSCSVCNKTETADHVDADHNNICDDCSAGLEIISVEITWGAMEFTYTDASEGTWNPVTYAYENPTPAGWLCDTDENKITVTSESSVDLNISFHYEQAQGVTVTGSFTNGTNPVTTALPLARKEETAQTVVVYLKLDGKPEETANKAVMGTVTVTIGD